MLEIHHSGDSGTLEFCLQQSWLVSCLRSVDQRKQTSLTADEQFYWKGRQMHSGTGTSLTAYRKISSRDINVLCAWLTIRRILCESKTINLNIFL